MRKAEEGRDRKRRKEEKRGERVKRFGMQGGRKKNNKER